MLAFHSHCQLGNQMFIYACAHSLSKKRGLSYSLSELRDLKYFVLSKNDYRWNSLKWISFRVKNLVAKFQFKHLQDNREDYSFDLQSETNKNTWYYGYFQGEQYFYENFENIRKRFQVKALYVKEFSQIKQRICGDINYTVIHIRLKDYKTFGPNYLDGPDLRLPLSYYHDLIKSNTKENKLFIFLSDDIESVKEEFSYVENAYFSNNSPIVDLQFIINAQTCILSCSTFSWWGAWLNTKEDKTIFVPDYFLGFKVKKEYPVNIIPQGWNKVKVIE
jgi:hypothetical protein